MFMYVFHIGSALLIMLGCGFVFCWKTNKGFWSYFLLGWAFQFLLCIPAGLWQGVFSWPGISSSSSLPWKIFVTPLLGWPFNAGGYTVRDR
ncbi:MAG TPA: hypothetical protein ENH43_03425, partial [Phycisphaerales bacterium]|nr:hypothetical protein [Phycisphaerales bacterium]